MAIEIEEKSYATQLEVAASDSGTSPVILGDDEDFKFTISKILALSVHILPIPYTLLPRDS
jgi:hypothetical protein